ncbi:hypothetical protein [Litoribrevibacter albus]|uniref:Bacteriophage tail tape measure N-terminal domain-containing protein n=1 Tax=Litoribrevibacter albus TaxID=1473156 RepID=A0AA37SAN6_9GAMM|nr:hypothetical protein [Litoribrevibacter albus]GLQ31666.1 hypothetical protein GCM10007876_21450 [Litoribrevibacter albus]
MGKSVISSLVVNIEANSARFRSELKASKKEAGRFAKFSKGAFGAVKVAGAAVAAASVATAGAMTALAASSFKSIDPLAKTADKLGVTTQSLVGLRHAAEQTAGMVGEQFDTALQRMTRRVSEAAIGTGEAKNAIAELGLDAQKLAALSPDEQFKQVADAMQNVANQNDKVRLAFKLFDSEGVGLVNTLRQGSDGLEAFQQEADALGLAVDRIDAAKIELANDAVDKAQKTFTGLGNAIAVKAAPYVKDLADRFTVIVTETNFAKRATDILFDTLVSGAGLVADAFHGWEVIFEGLKVVWAELKVGFMVVSNAIVRIAVNAGESILKALTWPIRETLSALSDYSDTAAKMAATLEDMTSFDPPEVFNATAIQEAESAASTAIDKFKAKLAEPMPSDAVKQWFSDVEEASRVQAESATKALIGSPEDVAAQSKRTLDQKEKNLKKAKSWDEKSNEERLSGLSQTFGKISTLQQSENKKLKAIGKAAAITQATIDGIVATNKALTAAPPPYNFVLAGMVGVASAANVAAIAGIAHGGMDYVPSESTYLLDKGERVLSPNQNRDLTEFLSSNGGESQQAVEVNITAFDSRSVEEALLANRGLILSMVSQAQYDRGRAF